MGSPAANGVLVPAGSDVYNPQADFTALNGSLHGRIMFLAANSTARTGFASTCGWTPTATDPLVVLQADTRTLWMYDGTSWYSILPAPRGGVLGQSSWTVNALTSATLTRTSGDTDLISSGNLVIPAGAGGTWALTANWITAGLSGQVRVFIQIVNNTTGAYWRNEINNQELGGCVAVVTNCPAATSFTVQAFTSTNTTGTTLTFEAWRLGS